MNTPKNNDPQFLQNRPETGGGTLQRRCFISSSLKNKSVVHAAAVRLRDKGLFVYDFTESDLPKILTETQVSSFSEALGLTGIQNIARSDLTMLRSLGAADVLLLILPAGFSAGWETGYASGRGAHIVVCTQETEITDLPLIHADHICQTVDEAVAYITAGSSE